MGALEELVKLIPPPAQPVHSDGDWSRIEASIGLKLPQDYKSFISTYGSGQLGGLVIHNPFEFRLEPRVEWSNWASMYQDFAEYGGETIPYPVYPNEGGLLPFGTLSDFHFLNWLTIGDSAYWPLVYYDRNRGFFEVKGLSAVEFVLEAVTQRSPLMVKVRHEEVFNPPCTFKAFEG